MILQTKVPGITYLYCDNGGEYVNNAFEDYIKSRGTTIHKMVCNTSALNGVAEQMNRTIMDRARACLIHSGMPPAFWSFAIIHSVFTLNQSPTKALFSGKNSLRGVDWKILQCFKSGHLRMCGPFSSSA